MPTLLGLLHSTQPQSGLHVRDPAPLPLPPALLAGPQVGSTLFAHGGVLLRHVDYGLERINRETQVGPVCGPSLCLLCWSLSAACAPPVILSCFRVRHSRPSLPLPACALTRVGAGGFHGWTCFVTGLTRSSLPVPALLRRSGCCTAGLRPSRSSCRGARRSCGPATTARTTRRAATATSWPRCWRGCRAQSDW